MKNSSLPSYPAKAGAMLLSLCLLGLPASSEACMRISRSRPIPVASEEVLIVWDAEHRTEHFVRRATFDTNQEFAFLVPTPSRPTLNEESDHLFNELNRLRATPSTDGEGIRGRARSVPGAGGPAARVEVVEERRVAGLDAAVLRASDPTALTDWLREHNFQLPASAHRWIANYVERDFFITAFRYQPAEGAHISSSAVRMSFQTDHPFFPYSEPAGSPRNGNRLFRLTMISQTYQRAKLGERAWRARELIARPMQMMGAPDNYVAVRFTPWLEDPQARIPSNYGPWKVQIFEERGAARGSSDLIFEDRAETASEGQERSATYASPRRVPQPVF